MEAGSAPTADSQGVRFFRRLSSLDPIPAPSLPRGRRTAEQPFRAKVFVNVRPVDSVTSAGNSPVLALCR